MRAVHLEASDGEGALPAELRHRVDGEEYLGALSVVCVGEEHLVCVCWSALARGTCRGHMARGVVRGMGRVAGRDICVRRTRAGCRVQGMGRGEARGTVAGESGGWSAVRRGVARAAVRGLASSAAGRFQVDSPVSSL